VNKAGSTRYVGRGSVKEVGGKQQQLWWTTGKWRALFFSGNIWEDAGQ